MLRQARDGGANRLNAEDNRDNRDSRQGANEVCFHDFSPELIVW
jgi:hypothetical protein